MRRLYLLILFLFACNLMYAQITFQGKIYDDENNPVPNAVITVQDHNISALSNKFGEFEVSLPKEGDYVFVISHAGFETQKAEVRIYQGIADQLTVKLKPKAIRLSEAVITANRFEKKLEDIPAMVDVVGKEEIIKTVITNTDDILQSVANVYSNRSNGIFSRNANVTMRGLDASARTLILWDGVPLNKTAGGTINWHLIHPENIERVEVIKGPASALYGNNAMGGVINIISKTPDKVFSGNVKLQMADYNTYGSSFNINGRSKKLGQKLYYNINGFYRQGDGYILEPEDTRDWYNEEAYLQEYSLGAKVGYFLNDNSKIEIDYTFFDDKRGEGKIVYEDDGAYSKYTTHFMKARYSGEVGKTKLTINSFFVTEDNIRQKESISENSQKYSLSESSSRKTDMGVWISAERELAKNHTVIYGLDVKSGTVESTELYFTSTDLLEYEGKLDFAGIFIQEESAFLKEKLLVTVGLRADFANFSKGQLRVTDPTSKTGFAGDYFEKFDEPNWFAVSPKVSALYKLRENISAYVSVSSGFMPPKLDDLAKSGKISKGFKIANPDLKPEQMVNYEFGGKMLFFKKLSIEPAVYYSVGKDFQYFVATGDSVDTGGDDLKPVLQRNNISEVEIIGGEISVAYYFSKDFYFRGNYTRNQSMIKKMDFSQLTLDIENPQEKDLEGKYLYEVPLEQAFFGVFWNSKWVNMSLTYHFIGTQWLDDINTEELEKYDMLNCQLSRTFWKHYRLSLNVQNIFDKKFIDRRELLSPGRFFMGEVNVVF